MAANSQANRITAGSRKARARARKAVATKLRRGQIKHAPSLGKASHAKPNAKTKARAGSRHIPFAAAGSAEAKRRARKAVATKLARGQIQRAPSLGMPNAMIPGRESFARTLIMTNPRHMRLAPNQAVAVGAATIPGLVKLAGGEVNLPEVLQDVVFLTAAGFTGNAIGNGVNNLVEAQIIDRFMPVAAANVKPFTAPIVKGLTGVTTGMLLSRWLIPMIPENVQGMAGRFTGGLVLTSIVLSSLELGAAVVNAVMGGMQRAAPETTAEEAEAAQAAEAAATQQGPKGRTIQTDSGLINGVVTEKQLEDFGMATELGEAVSEEEYEEFSGSGRRRLGEAVSEEEYEEFEPVETVGATVTEEEYEEFEPVETISGGYRFSNRLGGRHR